MCKYCENRERITLARQENLNVIKCYIHKSSDGYALFFENTNGMPAYISITACLFCGEKLIVPRTLTLEQVRQMHGETVYVDFYNGDMIHEVDIVWETQPGGQTLVKPNNLGFELRKGGFWEFDFIFGRNDVKVWSAYPEYKKGKII